MNLKLILIALLGCVSLIGSAHALVLPDSYTLYPSINGSWYSENSTGDIVAYNWHGDIVLQQTINMASPGQSILIKTNPLHSLTVVMNPIIINKTLAIKGESDSWYASSNPQQSVRIFCGIANWKCITINSPYVKLENIEIDSGSSGQTGLYVNGTHGKLDLIFNGNFTNGIYAVNSASSDWKIEMHNPFNGIVYNGTCIKITDSQTTIQSAWITGYGNVGIWHNQCSDGLSYLNVQLTPSQSTTRPHYGIRFGSNNTQGWFSGNFFGKLEDSGGSSTVTLMDIYKDPQESLPADVIGLYNIQGLYGTNIKLHTGAVAPKCLYGC